jgi:Lon protease-like protein
MELPLFPLHTVLCPGIALPLHIFEPRYRLLIERCVARSAPFGIVLILQGREVGSDGVAIAGVGTMAEIREATKLPDGRYDILVVGSGRFTVDEVDSASEPYLIAQVTTLADEVGDATAATALAARTMRRFVAYLQLLQPMEGETAEEIDVRVEIETEPASEGAGSPPEAGASPPEAGASPPEAAGAPPEAAGAPPERAGAPAEGSALSAPSGESVDKADDPGREAQLEEAARRLIIPEDPTVLSYLLSGIIQVDAAGRQRLLEADTTEKRLAALDGLIERELWMLRRRLRFFGPDGRIDPVRRN